MLDNGNLHGPPTNQDKGRLRKMKFGNIKKKWFFIIAIALILLTIGLPTHLLPVHAIPSSATSCAITDCAVSPVVNTAFASSRGNIASEAKIDQAKGFYDGATTAYGDTKPSIYIGLMARISPDARNSWNPNFNVRTLSITVTITDSSGTVFSPQPDSSGHAPVSTTFWYTPSSSGATDSSGALVDLAAWFAGFIVPFPSLPDLVHPQVTNGVTLNPNTIVGQWTDWGFNFPDNTLRCGIPCGSNPTTTDKSIELNVVPQFVKPDVYTISVSTHSEQGECTQGNFPPLTIVCSVDDKKDQSYSFTYVYENDAGAGGDAADSLPNAGGSPTILGHGSYTGFLYGIDKFDFYGITTGPSEKLSFTVTPPPNSDFRLTIYDQNQAQILTQDQGTGASDGLAFTGSGQTFFASISLTGGPGGPYSFRITNQFAMSASPSSVGLGLVGTGSSMTSSLTLSSPTDFSGQVTLSTSVTPAVANAPTVSISTVTATATAVFSPTSVVSTQNCPVNPSNAFASDSVYADFYPFNSCGLSQTLAKYGYSPTLPAGASITSVKVLVKHFEDYSNCSGCRPASSVYIGYPCVADPTYGCTSSFLNRSSDTTETVDITSAQTSWTSSNLASLQIMFIANLGYSTAHLDWLPLQVTYTYPTTTSTLSAGGSDSRVVTISDSSSTPAGAYTVSITGTSQGISFTIPITATVQDFQVSVSPSFLTVPPGTSTTTTVTVSPLNGFTGTVALSISAPGGITTGFSTNTITGGSGSAVLTISVTSQPSPDPATVTVIGTSGSRTQSTTLSVLNPPPAIKLSASPRPVITTSGQSGPFTLTVSSLYGFTGTVSITELGPSGLACSTPNPSSVTLTSTTTQANSAISCTAPAGLYTLNVTGTSGSIYAYTLAPYTVQDFTISATSPTIYGMSGSSTVTIAALYGFSGTVNLAYGSLPSGLSCNAVNPTSVTVPPTPATALLSCTSTSLATYTITITGTSGTLTHSATATLAFIDFTITSSPTTVNAQPGGSGAATINLASLNGLSGTISLSASQSVYATPSVDGFGSGYCHSTASNQCSAVLTTRNPGDLIIVFASSPTTLTNGFYIADSYGLHWNSRIFTQQIYQYPWQEISVQEFWAVAPGPLSSDTIIMTSQDPAGCCPSHNLELVTFGVSGSNLQFEGPPVANIQPGGNPQAFINPYLPNSMVIGYAVDGSQLIPAGPGFIYIGSSGNDGSQYLISGPAYGCVCFGSASGEWAEVADVIQPAPGFTFSFSPQSVPLSSGGTGSSSVTVSAASFVPLGTYTFYVTGAIQSAVHTVPIVVNVANFGVSANPTTVTVNLGTPATSTINVNGIGSFNGVVSLTSNNSNCSISPSSITGSGSSTLSCPSTSATSFPVTVTGTSGSESHSTIVNFNIQDFTLVANPTNLSILVGVTGPSTVTIGAINGFAGTVSLSATTSPSSGLSCWYNPSTITGSGTSTLYCNGISGTYTVTVTGTAGSLVHSTVVTYVVRDFRITVTPTAVSIPDGRSATISIQAASINGYSGTLSLNGGPYTCSTWSFGKPSLQLSPGGTDSTSLTLTMGPNCFASQYATYVSGYDSAAGAARYASFVVNSSDFIIFGQAGTNIGIGGQYTLKYNVTYWNNNNYPGSILTQTTSWGPNNCCLSTNVPSVFSATKPDVNSASGLISNINVVTQSFSDPWNGQGFYAQGRDWVFFIYYGTCSGTTTNCLYYATSTNGASWTIYNTGLVTGSTPSIVTNGTDVFYVRYNGLDTQSGKALMLGIGILHSDGTIAWQPEYTVKPATSGVYWYAQSMRVSTTGQIFVAYNRLTSAYGTGYPYVIHSNGIDYTTWQQETQLINRNDDWRFSLVPLPNGQMYILYWPYWGGLNGRLWSNGSWSNQETITPSNTYVQQTAFGFSSGNSTVYAIWQERTSQKIQFAIRNGSWSTPQTIFTADTNSNPRWSASYDFLHGKWYILYYSYSANQIWEYSGEPGAWSGKTVLYTTNGATSNSMIGTFYNTGQVNTSSNTLGIFWTQYDTSSNLQLKYANATIFTGGSFSTTWPITSTGSGSGTTSLTITASDGHITRSLTLQIVINGYNITYWYNDPTINQGSSSGLYLQIFSEYGIPLTNATIVPVSVPNSCLTVYPPSPKYFNIGPLGGYDFPFLPVGASSSCPVGNYQITVKVTGANGPTIYDEQFTFTVTVQTPPPPGGGGGSVAAGTLITLEDESTIPVEQLHVGMQVMSYNMTTHQFETSVITKFYAVTVDNYMTITISNGKTLTTDQNPQQRLYVKICGSTKWTLLPVTELRVGDSLFDAPTESWVPITSIVYHNGGHYVMYDIFTSAPGDYIANGILDPLKM